MLGPILTPDDRDPAPSPASEPDPGAALMAEWQAGDEGAFERLVERYSGAVWSLLTRFLGQREGREDLVQDVFLRVVRARDRYEPTARFTTWLYRIVFNLAVNETQRGRDTVSLEPDAGSGSRDTGALEVVDMSCGAPDAGLVRADLVAAVRAAIAELPESQRMALVLAKYEGLSQAEIADVIGSTEKAVKSLIHRARENLRALLIPYLEQEVA
ncbi:MAG: sigma-70 family RNA polymerase sigma factor [Planctomycetota bacterium]